MISNHSHKTRGNKHSEIGPDTQVCYTSTLRTLHSVYGQRSIVSSQSLDRSQGELDWERLQLRWDAWPTKPYWLTHLFRYLIRAAQSNPIRLLTIGSLGNVKKLNYLSVNETEAARLPLFSFCDPILQKKRNYSVCVYVCVCMCVCVNVGEWVTKKS